MKKSNLKTIVEEFFQITLVTYLFLLLAESIQSGFVSDYFNINILLAVTLATGTAMVLLRTKIGEKHSAHLTTFEWIFALLLVAASTAIVYYKTQNLGVLAYVASAFAGLTVLMITIYIQGE